MNFYFKGEIDGLMKQHPHLIHPSQRQVTIAGHGSTTNQQLRQPTSQQHLIAVSSTTSSQQIQQHLKQTNALTQQKQQLQQQHQRQPPLLQQQKHSQQSLHHSAPPINALRHQSHSTTTYYQQQHLQQQQQHQEQYRRYSSQLPAQVFAGVNAGKPIDFCVTTLPLPIATSMSATGVSSPSLSPHAYKRGHLMQRNLTISGGHAMESSNHTGLYNARHKFHHYPSQQQQSQHSFSSSEEDMHLGISGHSGHSGHLLTASNFTGSHLLGDLYDNDYEGK